MNRTTLSTRLLAALGSAALLLALTGCQYHKDVSVSPQPAQQPAPYDDHHDDHHPPPPPPPPDHHDDGHSNDGHSNDPNRNQPQH